MLIKDIIEGYFVLRELKKRGYVEEDGLEMRDFLRLVFEAEKYVKNMEVRNEDKQS